MMKRHASLLEEPILPLPASTRRDLLILWLAITAIAAVLAGLLFTLISQSAGPQIERAQHRASASCQALQTGLDRLSHVARPGASTAADAAESGRRAILDLVLRDRPGMEGGFWEAGAGVVAYAFPTYDGTGIKRDPPSAELERIGATAQRALEAGGVVTDVRPGLREAVVFSACPANAAPLPLAAWTLTRVPLISADIVNPLIFAVGLLLCSVVVSGLWLGRLLTRWRQQAAQLQRQLAQAETLATLGRMSAGLAHEIRNPLGTMRMRVENAMAAPAEVRETRIASALAAVLSQTQRLEALVASLLTLTQPFRVERRDVDLRAFLQERAQAHAAAAEAAGLQLTLAVDDAPGTGAPHAAFDPVQLARAFDNLLLNAIDHTPAGGTIELGGRVGKRQWVLWVADDGVGVPDELRDTLFEPFATGRPGGSGLGLALVREIVQAHGGQVALAPSDRGTRIEMELPWPAS